MSNTTHRGAQPNVLSTEPVTIGGAVIVFGNAVLGALPLFGVDLTAEQVGAANLVLAAGVALIIAVVRHFTVAKVEVVEQAKGGHVFAGEASELPTGTPIREIGDLQVADSPNLDPDAEV